MVDYDICILGAGLSGLYCAREIAKTWPDARIAILEKYEFIGGRVSTFKKTVPRVGKVQWEAGAGRIHKDHHKTLELMKEYGLTLSPLKGGLEIRGLADHDPVPVEFGKIMESYRPIATSSHTETTTIRGLLEKTVGKATAAELCNAYEYRSELDTLRADKGFEAIFGELGGRGSFFRANEGYSALIGGMKRELQRLGVTILRQFEVTDIKKHGRGNIITYTVSIKGHQPLHCRRVVVALSRDAVAGLDCFQGHNLLKLVKMRPLVRMYAVFPKQAGGHVWFENMSRFICPPPVRYVIPIDPSRGIIMISYTDGADAEYWMRRLNEVGEDTIQTEVLREIRVLFPSHIVPDPIFFKIHIWPDGCSYWTPGRYSIEKESYAAIQPLPDTLPGVWMCGESWAVDQCWMESALDHSDSMLKEFLKVPLS